MNYRKPGNRTFEVTGEVEQLGGLNAAYVYILTSKPREKRRVVRVETTEEIVKQFVPYLYQTVTALFAKGCVFINQPKS